ncbi:methyl-accepting chemotaxis protein [Halomonas sp. 707B3]|uniref:methyl-accepting chemotaxis protein n=1 Tax=Halomonas sp. 707B3 TaxID=1681043 RepID=UPI00209CD269|nr:methyl-accepting chemotaxis protein [Halomonas sp. 707B3]MCP1319550.1 methyl-accepting chemotaxis protein [Halomonas sp. 707B3]
MKMVNKISFKYAAAFTTVALSLLAVVAADFLLVNMAKDKFHEVVDIYLPAMSTTLNADRDLYQARVAEIEYVLTSSSSSRSAQLLASYEENAQQAYDRMQAYFQSMQSHPELLAQLSNFETTYSKWKQESSRVFELHQSGDINSALDVLSGSSFESFEELRSLYDISGQNVEAVVLATELAVADRIKLQQTSTLIFSLAVFALVMLVAVMGPKMMSRAIQQVSARIQEITEGDGDLTARIQSQRRDEIGELAHQFNAFIKRIDDTLQSVSQSTVSLQHASTEIAKGSQELASRTEQAAANLQQTSASMEQIAAVVNNASESAQQANQLALSTRDIAHQGLNAMQSVQKTMGSISESSSQIGEIVTMIESIAFQTNILALNASVEAARAGEHGRGFAVVAQEVRILASRTSDASKSISELISTSAERTHSGVSQVKAASDTLHSMMQSIERVADVVAEISAGAKEQSVGIGQVNDAVNELDSMTQHNASMVEESSAAAAELREQADRLSTLVGSFKLSNHQPIVDSGRRAALDQTKKSTLQLASTLPRNLVRQPTPEWESF